MENPHLDVLSWSGSQLVLAHQQQTLIDPEMIQIITAQIKKTQINNIYMAFFQKLRHVDMGSSFFFISYSDQYKCIIFTVLFHLPVSDIHKSFYLRI